jgi:hypothetical protein
LSYVFCDFYSNGMSPGQVRANGYNAVSTYISHEPRKTATAAEVAAFRGEGFPVMPNFEDNATNALEGYGQGAADATFVRQQLTMLDWPAGSWVPFSVDFQVNGSTIGTVVDYFRGVVSELGDYLAADYGSFYCLNEVHQALGLYGWQSSSWSGGMLSPYAALWQTYYGLEFDTDRLIFNVPIWGLEPYPVAAASPPPTPVPTPTVVNTPTMEDNMLTWTPKGPVCVDVTGAIYCPQPDLTVPPAPYLGALNAHAGATWNLQIGPGLPDQVAGISTTSDGGYAIAIRSARYTTDGPFRIYAFPASGVLKGTTAY